MHILITFYWRELMEVCVKEEGLIRALGKGSGISKLPVLCPKIVFANDGMPPSFRMPTSFDNTENGVVTITCMETAPPYYLCVTLTVPLADIRVFQNTEPNDHVEELKMWSIEGGDAATTWPSTWTDEHGTHRVFIQSVYFPEHVNSSTYPTTAKEYFTKPTLTQLACGIDVCESIAHRYTCQDLFGDPELGEMCHGLTQNTHLELQSISLFNAGFEQAAMVVLDHTKPRPLARVQLISYLGHSTVGGNVIIAQCEDPSNFVTIAPRKRRAIQVAAFVPGTVTHQITAIERGQVLIVTYDLVYGKEVKETPHYEHLARCHEPEMNTTSTLFNKTASHLLYGLHVKTLLQKYCSDESVAKVGIVLPGRAYKDKYNLEPALRETGFSLNKHAHRVLLHIVDMEAFNQKGFRRKFMAHKADTEELLEAVNSFVQPHGKRGCLSVDGTAYEGRKPAVLHNDMMLIVPDYIKNPDQLFAHAYVKSNEYIDETTTLVWIVIATRSR